MIKNIINKIYSFSLLSPIYAYDPDVREAAEAARKAAAANSTSNTFAFDPGEKFAGIKTVSVPKIISGGISVLMITAMVIFFVILVVGGIKWITSGGDEKKVAAARASVTNSLIGLAIVFASWAIMTLLGTLFGVDIFETFDLPTFY